MPMPKPRTALVLIDVIHPFDFVGGQRLLREAMQVAPAIGRLTRRARAARRPVIYANDNRGQWRSNFSQVVAACASPDARGADFVGPLAPAHDDYFVLKPQQSAFFATPLEDLLRDLKVRRLVLVGLAGDGCVLATAIDATMRDYEVLVPSDCIASLSATRTQRALSVLRHAWRVSTVRCSALRW